MFELTACGDDNDPAADGAGGSGGHHQEHDIDEHACTHFESGPFSDVNATADTTNPPDVSAEHTAFRIHLLTTGAGGAGGAGGGPGDSGSNGGYVKYPASEETEYVFFLNKDVEVQFENSSGQSLTVAESCDPTACSQACSAIKGKHAINFGVGTYYLKLSSNTETQVTLVVEEHHDH